MLSFATIVIAAASAVPAVHAHGYVKEWGQKGGILESAQKQSLDSTAFRAAPDSTGWVGSDFLETDAIACSASNTPSGQVAAPSGTFFSTSDQGASKTLGVTAGETVQLVIAGNPGEGWPHHQGTIQTYMADCGGDCKNFDVTKGKFFKIQEEISGIQNTLIPAYDSSVDGNRYDVTIPKSVPAGQYIFRFEMIAFGQSSSAEGGQDQYYPFCGQVQVGGKNGKRDEAAHEEFKRATAGQTVSFPGAYKKGNINQSSAPGPKVIGNAASIAGSGSGTASTGSGDSGTCSSSSGSSGSGSTTASTGGSTTSSALTLPSSAGACASMCLSIKKDQRTTLGASSCSDDDGSCMCGVSTFMQAFANCANDNCGSEAASAISALQSSCSGSSKRDVVEEAPAAVRRSVPASPAAGSGKSKRLHRLRRGGSHPATVALHAGSH